ncbi:MAG: hypothetical protein K8L99_12235 [Anaerolineae bacterium]|nr:hypothetical protein [Anaerolineae bacterium]
MADRQFGSEQFFAITLILITLAALVQFSNFSNADISFPTLVIAFLALLMSITRNRDVSH